MAPKISGIIDNDKGLKNLLNANTLLKNSSTAVGILSDAPKEGEMNMATLAAVHEFGAKIPVTQKMRGWFFFNHGIRLKTPTIFIPARPFMGMTFDRIREILFVKMRDILKNMKLEEPVTADGVRHELGRLGEYAVTEVKKTFDSGNFAALSDFTKQNRRKGKGVSNPKPLLDTGRLRASIAQRVDLNVKGSMSFKSGVEK